MRCRGYCLPGVAGLIMVSVLSAVAAPSPATQPAGAARPRIAVFPLGGDAPQEQRDKTAFSFRAKLDRQGKFEVIDGPQMADTTAQRQIAADFATSLDQLKTAADDVGADVLIWGDLKKQPDGSSELRVHLADRRPGGLTREVRKSIKQPTDLRFAVEQSLATLPQVSPFDHPVEEAVTRDPIAEGLWAKNPNLVSNGEFTEPGKWWGIYQADKYEPAIQDQPPAIDKVCIQRLSEDGRTNNVLAMNLSKSCAESNGMACLSEAIKIEPATRYRLSFRYKSDGPALHVFVKGYTLFPNINGELTPREIYRRQVPVIGATDGKWVTVQDDLNPQHAQYAVQTLRIDLYAYLVPGSVMFDDVVLKAVGQQTRGAKDAAIKPLPTQEAPAGH